MTTTHEAVVRPSALPNAPAAIFAVLGLIDVALMGVIGSADAPPLVVSLGAGALGLITLLSLLPARRSSRPALGIRTPSPRSPAGRASARPGSAAIRSSPR